MGAETTLYLPVKRFLESLGFEVKGEVCGCDVVALDKGVPTSVVIAELKLTFTLDLLLQPVDRLPACDDVWLAVRASGADAAGRTMHASKSFVACSGLDWLPYPRGVTSR